MLCSECLFPFFTADRKNTIPQKKQKGKSSLPIHVLTSLILNVLYMTEKITICPLVPFNSNWSFFVDVENYIVLN